MGFPLKGVCMNNYFIFSVPAQLCSEPFMEPTATSRPSSRSKRIPCPHHPKPTARTCPSSQPSQGQTVVALVCAPLGLRMDCEQLFARVWPEPGHTDCAFV